MMQHNLDWRTSLVSCLLLTVVCHHAAEAAPKRVHIEKEIVFATVGAHQLKLDLYLPTDEDETTPRPAIVAIHGGGMQGGDKKSFGPHCLYFAKRGFAAITVNYRLSDVARFPASIHDCKAAVRWLRANAEKYRIDGNKIGTIGSSAGGYLAVMLAATHEEAEFEGTVGPQRYSSRVQAAVPLAPPADLLLRAKLIPEGGPTKAYIKYLGKRPDEDPELWRHGSPINHVDKHSAPMLIMHATQDRLTPQRISRDLYERCQQVGAAAEFISIESKQHGFCNPRSRHYQPCMKQIVTFFRKTFDERAATRE